MASTSAATTAKVPALITTALVIVAVVFPILSLIAIFFRDKARRVAKQPFQVDDYWIVLSWLPLSAVKISILLFYKRIFTTPKFKLAVRITIPFIVAWGAIFFVLGLIQGDPISASWMPGEGHLRWDSTALGLAQVGSSVALDFIILCFPIPVIFGLHMRTQRKVAIALIFWVGGFCCIAAIVRLVFINQSVRQVEKSEYAIHVQSKHRDSTGSRSQQKSIDPAPRNSSSIDSHINLKQASADWSTAHNEGHVTNNVESRSEEGPEGHQDGVINITKAYDITRDSRHEENVG
ncbi:hypothetical protein HO133_000616 [Letharia lupina]|uniref:Rhodopsin domain-containing protein n=1 Tax=Letharia lupina TaxID=560253 RepID=A0A8H6CG33_9LECA|nr:uncharacterized protein HO133_000616 [Letharia lupina]KAF6222571.1 hypothetical protein HO133_000616 [Letharia lupina]